MATRSTIAVKHEDGTVSQIYCHWDGYLSHNGKLLVEHYNSLLAAEFLVSKGALVVLAPRVTPNPELGIHTFDVAQNGVCVYYGRDRGEKDTEPHRYSSVSEYLDKFQGEDYNYYFNGESWEVTYGETDFILVEEAMKLEAEDCE
jgi:hypothetical protein